MSFFNAPKFRKPGFKLALLASVLSLAVVLLGNYTRLADVDFGCSELSGCLGQFSFFGGSAGSDDVFGDYSSVDQGELWIELAHRYLAGVLGLVTIALALTSWRRRDDEDYPFRLPTFILFLLVWQMLFGLWTVKLSLWPQVATVHLVLGLLTSALLWLLTLRLDNKRWKVEESILLRLSRMRPWISGGVCLVIFQIVLGGWTSANHAGQACPDFPSCQGQWWPAMDMLKGFNIIAGFGVDTLSQTVESKARIAITVIHRLGALVTTVYVLLLSASLLFIKHRRTRRISLILMTVLGLQLYIAIGMDQISSSTTNVLMHNLGSALLLLTLVTLATKVWTAKLRYQRSIL